MQIQISSVEVSSSEAVNQRVHEELERSMKLFRERVTRVQVHLHDANGPKSGVDKRCVLEARIAGQHPVAVEARAVDMYDAITQAAGKLERAVRHQLERHDEKRK